MSNQKIPANKRHFRRGDKKPQRDLFKGISEKPDTNWFTNFINKILGKHNEDVSLPTQQGRRAHAPVSRSRDEFAHRAHKAVRTFRNKNTDSEKNPIKRSSQKIKTLGLYGGGLLFAAIIIVTVVLLLGVPKTSADSDEILNKVTLYINNETLELLTDVETVGELLEENEIIVADTQKMNYIPQDLIKNNMEIFISEPMTISVIQNDIKNSIIVYGGRVADVFVAMEIELDEYDMIVPDADTLIVDEMQIVFTDVEIIQVSEIEDLPYNTEEGETSTVETGYYHEQQKGENGAVQITYQVKLINGDEHSREEISREVIQEPVSRIILWGTASRSNHNDDSSQSTSGDTSSSYDDIEVKNPGEQATNPDVPAPPSNYIETMSGHVTAYTHTGSGTATGTWPRSTRTLDNPGTCAVVPGTISYGSLLYVTGYGYCIAEDTGAFRHNPDRWNQIDLFMNTYDECIIWGRRYDVKVYILRKGY